MKLPSWLRRPALTEERTEPNMAVVNTEPVFITRRHVINGETTLCAVRLMTENERLAWLAGTVFLDAAYEMGVPKLDPDWVRDAVQRQVLATAPRGSAH